MRDKCGEAEWKCYIHSAARGKSKQSVVGVCGIAHKMAQSHVTALATPGLLEVVRNFRSNFRPLRSLKSAASSRSPVRSQRLILPPMSTNTSPSGAVPPLIASFQCVFKGNIMTFIHKLSASQFNGAWHLLDCPFPVRFSRSRKHHCLLVDFASHHRRARAPRQR